MTIFSRCVAISLFLIWLNVEAFGQINTGIYLGLNTSTFSGDAPPKISYGFKNGFLVGGSVEFNVAKDVFVSLQPGFARGGGFIIEQDSDDSDVTYEYPVTNLSILVPATVRIYAKPRLFFSSGLSFAYLFKSTGDIRQESLDLTDEITDWNVSFLFGLGYQIPFSTSNLGFELQYAQGLNVITNRSVDDESFIPRVRINNVRVLVYYNFKLKD